MRIEDKLYIESYIYKLVSLCAEIDYKIDKFGNIVFEDKNKVIENINKIILKSKDQGIEASVEEIREYLIEIYKKRSENPEIRKEAIELISILESSKEDINKTSDKVDKNKSKEEIR